MQGVVLDNEDVTYMDELLFDNNGLLQVVPSSELAKLSPAHLMLWANKNAVYTYPTTELIEWLKEEIGNRSTIEICSGLGAIGRSLGIPFTDSYMQLSPEMALFYGMMGQKTIAPPEDVQKFEANEAVDHFKPEIVVGAFVTQLYQDGDEEAKIGSSVYGVDELTLVPKIKKYINIGNARIHAVKRIRQKFPHKVYRFPWLYTRAIKPEENEIVVYGE